MLDEKIVTDGPVASFLREHGNPFDALPEQEAKKALLFIVLAILTCKKGFKEYGRGKESTYILLLLTTIYDSPIQPQLDEIFKIKSVNVDVMKKIISLSESFFGEELNNEHVQ